MVQVDGVHIRVTHHSTRNIFLTFMVVITGNDSIPMLHAINGVDLLLFDHHKTPAQLVKDIGVSDATYQQAQEEASRLAWQQIGRVVDLS